MAVRFNLEKVAELVIVQLPRGAFAPPPPGAGHQNDESGSHSGNHQRIQNQKLMAASLEHCCAPATHTLYLNVPRVRLLNWSL